MTLKTGDHVLDVNFVTRPACIRLHRKQRVDGATGRKKWTTARVPVTVPSIRCTVDYMSRNQNPVTVAGEAYCSPTEPFFDPYKGQRTAFNRALSRLPFDREQRKRIWERYNAFFAEPIDAETVIA